MNVASLLKSLLLRPIRIRDSLSSALTKKFVDELCCYQNAQEEYKVSTQQKLKRQIRFVRPDASDEEIENMVQSGGDRDTLYKEMILMPSKINDRIR